MWQEDEDVWAGLDRLAEEAWEPLKELLDKLAEYNEDTSPIGQALLFAGIGRFFAAYRKARSDGFAADESLSEAIRQVYGDNRIQAMMQGAVHQMVDNAIGVLPDGTSSEA